MTGPGEGVGTRHSSHLSWRHVAWFVAALLAGGAAMAVTGWGTGDGPLGLPRGVSASMAVPVDIGGSVTDGGASGLRNHGWFDATIERIRPIPLDGAGRGMPVQSVRLAHWLRQTDGDGRTYYVPDEPGTPAEGFVLHPVSRGGSLKNGVQVVATYRVAAQGVWRYRGYEVTYRSGLVRHRMVIPFEVVGCAPKGTASDCGGSAS